MKQDTEKTKVLFLIEIDGDLERDNVFAYFPTQIWDGKGHKMSYSSIGQHSACHPEYANAATKAKPEQYNDLKKELENIGYNLDILN